MQERERWGLVSEELADYRIFRVLRKRGISPRTARAVEFHSLELSDWVQIIPCTRAGEFIMVEQFRPGAEIPSLEFPAGLIDDGELPLQAGLRELEEETGYRAHEAWPIGHVYVNPAIQSNRLHIVHARDCQPDGLVQQDEGEDVRVRLVAESELLRLMEEGTIHHALVLTAWKRYELWRVQREASRT